VNSFFRNHLSSSFINENAGFLNKSPGVDGHYNALLEAHMNKYDVVLVRDDSMDFVNDIIDAISNNNNSESNGNGDDVKETSQLSDEMD
jgi:hypothetical protein